jgi:hypothetical protein
MVGDTWQELSGYDGRFLRTFRLLMCHPGALTIETLEGRRARFITPVRLYLVASVLYFLVAASAPHVRRPAATTLPGTEVVKIDLMAPGGAMASLTPEQQLQVERSVARAPQWLRPSLRKVIYEPDRFKTDFLQTLPRVLFVLVPLFAAIVALFYWGRPLSQHLVFSLHFHSAIFVALAVYRLSGFTRSLVIVSILELVTLLFVVAYGLLASRAVYRESWVRVSLKAAGIAVVYAVPGGIALVAAMAIAALN